MKGVCWMPEQKLIAVYEQNVQPFRAGSVLITTIRSSESKMKSVALMGWAGGGLQN